MFAKILFFKVLLSSIRCNVIFKGMLVIRTVILLCACWVLPVCAGTIYSQFPTEIDPHGHYVFYSHGFIVEGTNPKPVHKTFGVYDFVAVKEARMLPFATDPMNFKCKKVLK